MPRLRSLEVVPKPPPPPQLCAECFSLRQRWLDTVGRAALVSLKFDRQKQIHLMAGADVDAFRRYVVGRRSCKVCSSGFTELGILVEPLR